MSAIYPHASGDYTVIGPECFTDGTVIAYKGENYTRQPRTITTAEELDALPVGAVVLSDQYLHHVDHWKVSFQRWDDGTWHRGGRSADTHPDNFLPATILYTPEQSA